ncbi:caspase family protein [Streptomyces sp. NPDC054794]
MSESRHALIIANDSYADQGLKQLNAPGHDAEALHGVLGDPRIGDFEVDVRHNLGAQEMRTRIEDFFADRSRDDQLVLHFSCHGIKSESGELYFAASDTQPRLLDATAISAQFVHRCMSRTRAGCTALFLDCCYGGAFSRGASVRAAGDMQVLEAFEGDRPSGGRGWAVVTASNSMEYAFEGGELTEGSAARPSVFTHAVVEGLESGAADRSATGTVTLDELYDYVYDRVREQNPNQTPSKTVEMQGSMMLAHSRHREPLIEPEPLPRAVQDALRSRNGFSRLGAVAEVRARMASPMLPVAEGARRALEAVVRDDTQQIADEARRALDDVRLQPDPVRLDFGRVPRGTAVPPRTVTLRGIPLARHCAAHATGKWLRAEPSAEGLAVEVDTSAEGRLTGDILLKGVADDAVVHVEAEVVPHAVTPPRPTRPPTQPPPEHGLLLAPALASAALALAVTSVITFVAAAVATAYAVQDRAAAGTTGEFAVSVKGHGVLPLVITALVTAAAALLCGALARRRLSARRTRYTPWAKTTTRSMTSVARRCAVPVLVLTVLWSIAYNIVSKQW